ncbi:MAG: glutathione S-transferase [Salaquimonas sp.]|jgi:glutathione S-transferase|nr:glutathione S-transferase [Salaquimonas sp.]
MKLWHSPASPFVRKVMVLAHETGQTGKLTTVEANTNAVNRNEELAKDNPCGKIPALVLDDGTVLFDSRVICAYLDSLHSGPKLTGSAIAAGFRAMVLEALGDATMDAAVLTRYEQALRPAEYRWDKWEAGQLAKVNTSLDDLEARWMDLLEGPLSVGSISVACALGYLDYRFPDSGWRESRPKLAGWYAAFAERPSMVATKP